MVRKEIRVDLGNRSYPIYFGSRMLSSFSSACNRHGIPKQGVIVSDHAVSRLYLKPLRRHLAQNGYDILSVVFPSGESQKSLQNATTAYTKMLKGGLGRRSVVFALGGGVIGDLAGFIAATYHRGIPLVQIPTTLLSQVDSSVGGKTAVNHPMGKNMIGAFYQPVFVWTDMDVLKTLPPREILCGLGEIVKYGVILDESLFSYLETNLEKILSLERETVMHVQERCCSIKAGLVSRDERESGERIVLNFGHTVGHALEAAGKYRILKHGEAVLLGMIAESFIARETGLIGSEVYERIVRLITRIPLRTRRASLKIPSILNSVSRDKKNVKGKTRFVLPAGIGVTRVVDEVPEKLIKAALTSMLRQPFSTRGVS